MSMPDCSPTAEPAIPMTPGTDHDPPGTGAASSNPVHLPESDVGTPTVEPGGHPLGPVIAMVRIGHPITGRLYAAAIAAAAVAFFAVAARLSPSSQHLGTHRQLGLPPCGCLTVTGFPCPTCGMTTAFAATVRGHILQALRANVAGTLMAAGTAGTALIAAWCVLKGRYPAVNWYRVRATRVVWLAALVILVSWGLNIALGLIDGSLPAW